MNSLIDIGLSTLTTLIVAVLISVLEVTTLSFTLTLLASVLLAGLPTLLIRRLQHD